MSHFLGLVYFCLWLGKACGTSHTWPCATGTYRCQEGLSSIDSCANSNVTAQGLCFMIRAVCLWEAYDTVKWEGHMQGVFSLA